MEKEIWDFLIEKIGNAYGVAGLMGNLYVESHLNPKMLQSSYARKLNMSSEEYTKAVDSGSYTAFSTDSAGYGLAQWTYSVRKKNLLIYAQKHESSIGNLQTQLGFLWEEIQTYKTVLKTLKSATSVRQASDVVCERYEKPKNQTETGKQNRAEFGMRFYSAYAGGKKVVTTDKVNIRAGDSKEYAKLGSAEKGNSFEWVATAENGWHAIRYKDRVAWVSGEFSQVK